MALSQQQPVVEGVLHQSAARTIQHHLVHDSGPQPDPNTPPERGKIAFAYRKTAPAHPETRSLESSPIHAGRPDVDLTWASQRV
jgi:hypothetical protein